MKQPLSVDDQIELLKQKGVVFKDLTFARQVLLTVNYYRFSAYLFPFRLKNDSNKYIPGTSFDDVWQYYRFDRKLRFLVLDALERVEVATRSLTAYRLAMSYGTFGYRNIDNYASNPTSANIKRFNDLLEYIDNEIRKSREEFVIHFKKTYDIANGLPIWMATEVMTFGNTLTMFRLMKKQDMQYVARELGSNEHIFESWLMTLNYIRNICAHHGRLWNRQLAVSPLIPKKDPDWHENQYPIQAKRLYSVLCILRVLLRKIVPQSKWPQRLVDTLEQFQQIPRNSMGIPKNFTESAIWRK